MLPDADTARTLQLRWPRADPTLRALARLTDTVIAAVLAALTEFGPLLAAAYLLTADAWFKGQSPGKKIFGVRVMFVPTRSPAGWKQSALRNAPFALLAVFYGGGLLGWVLLFFAGAFVVGFEIWVAATDRWGLRIGDIFADTQVIDAREAVGSGVAVPGR